MDLAQCMICDTPRPLVVSLILHLPCSPLLPFSPLLSAIPFLFLLLSYFLPLPCSYSFFFDFFSNILDATTILERRKEKTSSGKSRIYSSPHVLLFPLSPSSLSLSPLITISRSSTMGVFCGISFFKKEQQMCRMQCTSAKSR